MSRSFDDFVDNNDNAIEHEIDNIVNNIFEITMIDLDSLVFREDDLRDYMLPKDRSRRIFMP